MTANILVVLPVTWESPYRPTGPLHYSSAYSIWFIMYYLSDILHKSYAVTQWSYMRKCTHSVVKDQKLHPNDLSVGLTISAIYIRMMTFYITLCPTYMRGCIKQMSYIASVWADTLPGLWCVIRLFWSKSHQHHLMVLHPEDRIDGKVKFEVSFCQCVWWPHQFLPIFDLSVS